VGGWSPKISKKREVSLPKQVIRKREVGPPKHVRGETTNKISGETLGNF